MKSIKFISSLLLVAALGGVSSPCLMAQTRRTEQKFSPRAARQKISKTTPSVADDPALVKSFQQRITPESLAARLYFLASDFFEGRGAGTRGQKLAAEYLASQYRQLGLAPKGTTRTTNAFAPADYFQTFPLYRLTPKETRLEVTVKGVRTAESVFSADKTDDLSFYAAGGATSASGGIVFAGYGIADDDLGYNDYAELRARGISVAGKWILMLADEPLADASTSLLPTPNRRISRWTAGAIDKTLALWKTGRPLGVLVVRGLSPGRPTFSEQARAAAAGARTIGNLALDDPSDIPQTYSISAAFADRILASAGYKIEDLKRQIDRRLKPTVFEIKDALLKATVEPNAALQTENVLAFLEGSDPKLKNEVVVVSSHYDHLGSNPLLAGDTIYNGAADDGSGTVAALEIAQAFINARREGYAPRRSILFANFSAEERGLLGSLFYTNKQPVVPLENVVADINMDGIGGRDPAHPTKSKNYVYIGSAEKLSDSLLEINRQVHRTTGSSLELSDGNGKGFGSDHQSFEAQLVPFIYYSTGRTEHYHQVGDEPQTIDYEHFANVTRLVFAAVWQGANQPARVSDFDRRKFKAAGYVCRPCNLACDREIFERAGNCPMCGMALVPRWIAKDD